MPLKALAAWFAQMSRESPFAAIYLLLFIIIIFSISPCIIILTILGPLLEAFTEGVRVGPPGHSFSSRPSVDKGF